MSPEVSAILATLGISLIALVGLFLTGRLWNQRLEVRLVSFAAGVLLATTFLDLLPEAIHEAGEQVMIASLVAMTVLFYLERLVHSRHKHTGSETHIHHHTSASLFILIGDGIHNFIDGVAIAISFLVNPELGIATTVAVAAHELPHEVGDYAVLRRGGFSSRRALFYNFLSALTAVLGALVTFAAQDFVTANLGYFIAAVAGMFIYIAAANLIPELHHQRVKGRMLYGLPFLLGILTISLLLTVMPHQEAEGESAEPAHTATESAE
mgnify:CR=1 FL=1